VYSTAVTGATTTGELSTGFGVGFGTSGAGGFGPGVGDLASNSIFVSVPYFPGSPLSLTFAPPK
jgi:hypothetical protein